ncbi:MAG: hypothetical protein IJY36_07720 [Coprobacter sp.]|nr:hypothetical protein [Coprobacter sp.]
MKILYVILLLVCVATIQIQAQSYTDYIDSSFTYIEKGELSAAEQALLKALRTEPGNPGNVFLLSNLGTIQRQMGKNREALQSYNNALMMAPQSTTLLANRAALWAEIDSLQQAKDDYTRILQIDDKNEDAIYRRGLISLECGDTTASRLDFEWLLSINPQSADARIGMATLLKHRGYYLAAIELYTQVLRANPNLGTLYLNRAEAYYYNKQYNKADDDIATALYLSPQDPLVYVMRGKLKIARFDKEGAQKDFDKAIELGFDANVIEDILHGEK